MDHLAPCPSCDNPILGFAYITLNDIAIWCDECGMKGPARGRKDLASNDWNDLPRRRAKPKKEGRKKKLRLAKAQIAELNGVVDDLRNQILSMQN